MSHFFLDSSALVKRYLTEAGSSWVTQLTQQYSENIVFISEITQVEVAAALAARHRAPNGITRRERDGAVDLLARHCETEYRLVAMSRAILDQAVALTQDYRLRGYDAVQLATALLANTMLITAGLPGLSFVAADDDLLTAARAEKLAGENPNKYP